MRIDAFVIATAVIAVDWAGINSLIDLQQRHSYPADVVVGQRPKTAVPVSVLGANARVHDKCAAGRYGEQPLLQKGLAARQHQIWRQAPNERLDLGEVRAGDVQYFRTARDWRVSVAILRQLGLFPQFVATLQRQ